jgi:signal transduction histidine kinase
MLMVGLVAIITRKAAGRKLKRRLRELQEQNAVERERMRIAQDMHDELGAKLSRISFLSSVAQRDLQKPDVLSQDIQQIASTARDVLQGFDEIVWAVSPQNDSLDHLATYLCQYTSKYFEHTEVRALLDIPARLPELGLSAEVRHHLFLAFKQALANVLKHSNATELRIKLQLDHAQVILVVEDNGTGFDSAKIPMDRNGLSNMRQRLEGISGKFKLHSAPGKGTVVEFTVPLRGT